MQRISHDVTSDPWYIETEYAVDDGKKLKVCHCKSKRG